MASPPAWSIGTSKRSADKAHGVPGPGAYNAGQKNKPNNPSWRLGTSSRSVERRSEVPGPGSYNSPGKVSSTAPQYVFGAKTSTDFKGFTPGPGAYNPSSLRGYDAKAPSYTFRVKSAHPDDKTKVPGPGTYDQSSRIANQASPAYRIGSSKRDDIYHTGATPGPGTYSTRPNSAYGPKYGFGSSERDSSNAMNRTAPGPGAYNYKGDFGGNGRGTSLVPRRPDSALLGGTRNPGPGAYNPSMSLKTSPPAYRIGSATRDSKDRSGTPGPGNYDPRLMSGNQNVKIGTSTRTGLYGNKTTPGPGTYNYGTKVGEGPKYVINPRRDDDANGKNSKYIPGPGAYNPSVDAVKSKNSSIGIGTSSRYDLHPTKANPGPGQYDTRGRLAGPQWGFGTQSRSQERKSEAPGPGQYKIPHTVGDVPKYAYGSSPLKIHL